LPEHCSQGAGYILRPGWVGCVTGGNPVPLQAEQLLSVQTSFGSGVFIVDPLSLEAVRHVYLPSVSLGSRMASGNEFLWKQVARAGVSITKGRRPSRFVG
jgi:hypothetical protein